MEKKEDIISKLSQMADGEKNLFAIGMEIGLGLKTWEDIIKSCEDFNNRHFRVNYGKERICDRRGVSDGINETTSRKGCQTDL